MKRASELTKKVKLEDQDEERVSAFIQAITQINDFFTFGIEEYDIARYCERCIQIIQDMLDGSADHQARVIKLLGKVKTKFEDDEAVLPVVSELTTLKEKMDFYRVAIDYITFHCYQNDEDFTDFEFNYPLVLEKLQELAMKKNYQTCLAKFLAKVKTMDRTCGPNNTSSFWKHIEVESYTP